MRTMRSEQPTHPAERLAGQRVGRHETDSAPAGASSWFQRADGIEHRICLFLNRSVSNSRARRLFATISRLGDGPFWYGLLAALPIAFGRAGLHASVQMGVAAILGVAIYLTLKTRLVRERPYITHIGIEAHAAPLDRYSFPSGHTLHAVCFTSLTVIHFPWMAVPLVPFALLIAASRVIMGLHYPSDVLAGAAIGAALAGATYAVIPG